MTGLRAALALGSLYVSLSPAGRRFARRAAREGGEGRSALSEAMADRRKWAGHVRAFRACDRLFARSMPPELCRSAGRDRDALYGRFVPFSAFILSLRARFLEAYGVRSDGAALERGALFSFIHREWNDLQDRIPMRRLLGVLGRRGSAGAVPGKIRELRGRYEGLARDTSPEAPELAILSRMVVLFDEMVPSEVFTAFAGMLGSIFDFMERADPADTTDRDPSGIVVEAIRTSLVIMAGDLPTAAEAALGPFARWLYGLDELADVDRDRARNVRTSMTASADPEGRLGALLEAAEAAIRASARDPEWILSMMRPMTDRVRRARRDGIDLERGAFRAER